MDIIDFVNSLKLASLHIKFSISDMQLANWNLERGEYEKADASIQGANANMDWAAYFHNNAKL